MNNAWQVAKTVFLRLRFIFVFVVIGLIVGNWAWIKNVVDPARNQTVTVTLTRVGSAPAPSGTATTRLTCANDGFALPFRRAVDATIVRLSATARAPS